MYKAEFAKRQNGKRGFLKWKNIASTLHVAKPPSGIPCTVGRRQVDGSLEDVVCPPCLPDYQTFMRGVDRIDQLGSYYNVGRRLCKWWKRVFSYGIECSLGNSYVLDGYV